MASAKLAPTGKQIKIAMLELDISYMDLAKAMGCSVYYVREICVDTRKAVEMRDRIARYLVSRYKKYRYTLPRWASSEKAVRQEIVRQDAAPTLGNEQRMDGMDKAVAR